jgi:hypothetical protein
VLGSSGAGDSRLRTLTRGTVFTIALAITSAACASRPVAHGTNAQASSSSRPTPGRPPPPKPAPVVTVDDEVYAKLRAGVEYGDWTPIDGEWRYLAPKKDFVAKDGGVDVAFHFHGAEMAGDDWRQSGLNAVIISVTLPGVGNTPYKLALADPSRFGAILDEVIKRVGATHSRRIAVFGFSAGYAAVGQVLSNDWYYSKIDTVVLLDGLHASLVGGKPEEKAIAIFEQFARDAVAGNKTMVVTHSSVVPPNYASTTQMTDLLLASAHVPRVEEEKRNAFGMIERSHADAGNLHLRGYRGDGPKDHMDQLRLLSVALTDYIVPRWTRLAVQEARQ